MTEVEFLNELRGAVIDKDGDIPNGYIRLKPPPNCSDSNACFCPITYVACEVKEENYGVDDTKNAAASLHIEDFDGLILEAADHRFEVLQLFAKEDAEGKHFDIWLEVADIRRLLLKSVGMEDDTLDKEFWGWE